MRIAFLTGIWPPDVGGPATHGPDFSTVPRRSRPRRPRRHDGRRRAHRAAVRGRGRLAPAAVPAPLRAGRAPRRPRGAECRRRLRDRRRTRPQQPRRRWRGSRSSRSSSPIRPTSVRSATGLFSGHARGVPVVRSRPSRALKALRTRSLRRPGHARRAERVPGRDRWWRGGCSVTGSTCSRTLRRRRARSRPSRSSPGRSSSSADSRAQKALWHGDRGDRRSCRRRGSSSSGTGRSARELQELARRSARQRRPDRVSRHSLARRSAARRRRRRGGAALERLGEPAALPPSRRSPSECPSSRRGVGGVPEVVRDGENGLLVPPGRPDELAAAIRRLLVEDRSPRPAGCGCEAVGRGDLERGRLRPDRVAACGGGALSERPPARPLRRARSCTVAAARLAGEEVGRGRGAARLPHSGCGRAGQRACATSASGSPRRRGRGGSTGSSSTSGCRYGCASQLARLRARRDRRRRPIRRRSRARSDACSPARRRP